MKHSTRPFDAATRQHRWLSLVLCGLVCLSFLAACGSDAVDQAEERWQAAGIDDYRLQVRDLHSTWCYYDLEVEVRGDEVVSGYVTANPGPAGVCGLYGGTPLGERVPVEPAKLADWTVPHLFEIARRLAAERGERNVDAEVELHPELGYPTRLARDNEIAHDDDWLITVSALEPLGGSPQ